VQRITPDGDFGASTEAAVKSFQKTYGLEPTGIVDRLVWSYIQNTYYNTLASVNFEFSEGATLPYPGRILTIGSVGEDVRALQEYLNYISLTYPQIPKVNVDGEFGAATERAVIEFKRIFGINGAEGRVTAQTWRAITDIYEDLYVGGFISRGQFPGYDIE
jgi:peptidoglycan hydrolase-like protein with peptidoglycan-binding domain